ncbi:cytochrome b5, partial [Colletotrichum falcatum]
VRQHRCPEDCWIAIHGQVYNITAFLASHTGGKSVLLKNAGKDSTDAFNEVH